MEFVVGVVVAVFGMIVSVYLSRNSVRQLAERSTVRRFLRVRQVLSDQWLRIVELLDSGLALTREGWLLPKPLLLDALTLRFVERDDTTATLDRLSTLRRYLPIDATGRRIERYNEAVSVFDRPALWFNANTYRLIDIEVRTSGLTLSIGRSRYWDCFDFAEGLRHEAAHHFLRSGGRTIDGRFRKSLRDPFAFTTRHCGLGFATLTIRADGDRRTFYLHRRGGEVAVGKNETSLVPAGEFQPSDDSDFALQQDLDLWYAMMREYAEELLNVAEVRQAGGAPIDYRNQSPFREMYVARTTGSIRPYLLGIGLDPISWKAQIYTACVFDAPVFDGLFADMPTHNQEGVLEVPTHQRTESSPLRGWEFTEPVVTTYLKQATLNPSAKLVLGLSWEHRSVLF